MEATDEPALLELADGREDGSSFEALVALLYEELHALAHRALARESPGHTPVSYTHLTLPTIYSV